MNKNLQTVFSYHEETKHNHHKYAKSIGYMDWANQPNPYRTYENTLHVKLPFASNNTTPPYHLLFDESLPSAPLLIDSISQFLQFSMGIAAIKSDGINEWALRCNASSGNLHPSEAYIILPPTTNISQKTTISHYGVQNHSLEILHKQDSNLWENLPQGSFLVALSSITYREVWKYGERAFRYVNLDAGHAKRSLQISAKTLGWKYRDIVLSDDALAKLFCFDKKENFSEHELPDMLMLITPTQYDKDVDLSELIDTKKEGYVASAIATNYQNWPLIEEIEKATFSHEAARYIKLENQSPFRKPTKEAKEVILKRRSAQMMDKEDNEISYDNFKTILKSTQENFSNQNKLINLILFVHNITELKPGLYIFLRDNKQKDEIKKHLSENFIWEKIDEDFYALFFGDFKEIAQSISCNQAIASDGAFSLGMLSPFADEIITNGAHTYKELYWECGAIGQQLYLEATSLHYQATGIGCYLDDVFHSLLGLKSNKFQSLYHFTIGKALIDTRVLSKKPYEE